MSLTHPIDGRSLNYFNPKVYFSTGDDKYDAITSEVLFPTDSTGDNLRALVADYNQVLVDDTSNADGGEVTEIVTETDNNNQQQQQNNNNQQQQQNNNNQQQQQNNNNNNSEKNEENNKYAEGIKSGLKRSEAERLARYSRRRQSGVLRYPLEAMTEHTDYLQMDIEQYEPIGSSYVNAPGDDSRYATGNPFTTNRAGRRPSDRLSTKPLINAGTILLPIPSDLSDSNNVRYDSSNMNGLAAAGVQAVEGIFQTSLFDANQAKKNLDQVKTNLQGQIKAGTNESQALNVLNKFLAGEAANIFGGNVNVNQLLARGNGEILNPNMELLFGGPTLRNFRFSFKLTPRNQKEAQQVRLIIRAFKRNMAARALGGRADGGNWYLSTPNIFKLRYRTGRKNHPFLHKFKQCFLSDMSTKYTGEGVYSTYDDGTPVSILLDLSFKEIQPIYDIDYDNKPGTEAVGY